MALKGAGDEARAAGSRIKFRKSWRSAASDVRVGASRGDPRGRTGVNPGRIYVSGRSGNGSRTKAAALDTSSFQVDMIERRTFSGGFERDQSKLAKSRLPVIP